MRVMYTLHEHALARQLVNVWMMVRKRVNSDGVYGLHAGVFGGNVPTLF